MSIYHTSNVTQQIQNLPLKNEPINPKAKKKVKVK